MLSPRQFILGSDSQDTEWSLWKKEREGIIVCSRYMFELLTAMGSYDSIPLDRLWGDTEESTIYGLAPIWLRVVPVVSTHLLQVCKSVEMAEWFCDVPHGYSANPGRKLKWGVVQLHTVGCWSASWDKKGAIWGAWYMDHERFLIKRGRGDGVGRVCSAGKLTWARTQSTEETPAYWPGVFVTKLWAVSV